MTSTGKKARKRYGNRFAAKQRRDGSKAKKSRKRFGKLEFSCAAKNVPEGAVRANDALIERIFAQRREAGWEDDANVSVPGPTRESVEARRKVEERLKRKQRRDEDYGEEDY